MDEKVIKALVEAGAVRQVRIVAAQATVHVEIKTAGGTTVAQTLKGKPKTWSTIQSAAKWVRSIGVAEATLDLRHWTPDQRPLSL